MSHWLCRLRGHQRTRVVFATNRFYCRRCGLALDPDPMPEPESDPTTRSTALPRLPTRSARTASNLAFPRSRPYAGPATRARERHRPVR
jgi:hypothetical protein